MQCSSVLRCTPTGNSAAPLFSPVSPPPLGSLRPPAAATHQPLFELNCHRPAVLAAAPLMFNTCILKEETFLLYVRAAGGLCTLDDMHDHYSQSAEKVLWERQLVSRAAGPPLCNPTLLSSLKPQIEKQTGSTVCWTGRASAAAEASRCRGRRQDGRGRLDTVGTPCHRVEQGRGGEGRVNKD